METVEISQIRALFQKFQDGYTRRDLANLDAIMDLFVDDEAVEVIGTNALVPGEGEWCLGRTAVRELVAGDWEGWGDVVYDVDQARIHVMGDVGWLAATGRVTDTITEEERYSGFLDTVKSMLEEQDKTMQEKTLDIVTLGNDIVLGLPLSETFVWPLRFTAVVVKQAAEWRFHQMQFSFATTRAPDEREL